jgi:hypothetical protein
VVVVAQPQPQVVVVAQTQPQVVAVGSPSGRSRGPARKGQAVLGQGGKFIHRHRRLPRRDNAEWTPLRPKSVRDFAHKWRGLVRTTRRAIARLF